MSLRQGLLFEASEDWSKNIHQAKVVNLQLPAKLYYWGTCEHSRVVIVTMTVKFISLCAIVMSETLDKMNWPAIFYGFSPDTLLAIVPHHKLTFPATTPECLGVHSSNNTWGANTTLFCDPYDSISFHLSQKQMCCIYVVRSSLF